MVMVSTTSSFPPPLLLLVHLVSIIISFFAIKSVKAFSTIQPAAKTTPNARCRIFPHLLRATSDVINNAVINSNDDDATAKTTEKKGDSLRDATGIRPSLHPTTINCVAEALLLRSQRVLGKTQTKEGQEIPIIDTSNPDAEPLEIAVAAAGIAMAAIDQRKSAAETDETTDEFTMEESQTISGRVVGVVMRMRELEQELMQKVNDAKWVKRYSEEESFGVLKEECEQQRRRLVEGIERDALDKEATQTVEKQLAKTIKIDPLLRMNRAECLLALFLATVEAPKLEALGEDVAGGSRVDFIDVDRLEVLA